MLSPKEKILSKPVTKGQEAGKEDQEAGIDKDQINGGKVLTERKAQVQEREAGVGHQQKKVEDIQTK